MGVVALAALAAALAPGTAGAVKLGTPHFTDDDVDFGGGCGAPGPTCTFMQKKLPGAKLRAPFSGKVTKWRVAEPGGGIDVQLVVMRKRKNGKFEAIRASELETTPNVGAFTFDTKLRIKRGDYVAIHGTSLAGRDNPNGLRLIFNSPLMIGEPQTGVPLPGDEYLYNATIKR